MKRLRILATACTLIALTLQTASAQVAAAPAPYTPKSGQAGKDVVWVPSPQALVDRMLDMAKVTKNDYVIDLGSGDGRTVITAAKRGARSPAARALHPKIRSGRQGRRLGALAAGTGRPHAGHGQGHQERLCH